MMMMMTKVNKTMDPRYTVIWNH